VTGTGEIPSGNVTPPNKKLFDLKNQATKAKIEAGRETIAPTPFFMVADRFLKAAGEVLNGSVPYPQATQQEKDRRSNRMRQTVEQETDKNFKNKN